MIAFIIEAAQHIARSAALTVYTTIVAAAFVAVVDMVGRNSQP